MCLHSRDTAPAHFLVHQPRSVCRRTGAISRCPRRCTACTTRRPSCTTRGACARRRLRPRRSQPQPRKCGGTTRSANAPAAIGRSANEGNARIANAESSANVTWSACGRDRHFATACPNYPRYKTAPLCSKRILFYVKWEANKHFRSCLCV